MNCNDICTLFEGGTMNCDDIWVPPLTETVQNLLREARVIANQHKDKYVRMKYLEIAIHNELKRIENTAR